MRTRAGSFSKLRASIRRSSAKLVQKLTSAPNGPTDAAYMGGCVSVFALFTLFCVNVLCNLLALAVYGLSQIKMFQHEKPFNFAVFG